MFTAHTLDNSEFTADTLAELITKIGDWQGENVDDLRGAVEVAVILDGEEAVHPDVVRNLNKDLEVWFENERELSRNMDNNEHRTY